jgi:hypothetical protein
MAQRPQQPMLTSLAIPANRTGSSSVAGKLAAKAVAKEDAKRTTKVDLPTPVKFIRSLFEQTSLGQVMLSQPKRCPFEKPSEDMIDEYDLNAVRAIREGSVPKLRALLNEGKSMDACNRFGESLMHMACRRGDLPVIIFLVNEAHARLDVRDDFGRTPLHDACWTALPNFDVMDVLIRAAPPDLLVTEDVRGHTPFHYARKEHWSTWVNFCEERRDLLLLRISLLSSVS